MDSVLKFLPSTENDDYKHCAGDVTRKCTIDAFTRIEQNADQDFLTTFKKYQDCFEKEGETCDAAIMKHFLGYIKADEKLIEDEGQGEFKKVLEGIPAPHVEL